MSNNRGLISAPISLLDDVKYVLGESSRDLKTLCQSAKINKWAKYKPISSSKIGALTYTEREESDFGLTIPRNISNYPLSDDFKNAKWEYKPITGVGRLTDFDGYYHDAPSPVIGSGDVELNPVNDSKTFQFRSTSFAPDKSLVIEDFVALRDYYPCLVLEHRTGDYIYKTAEHTFSSNVMNISISKSEFPFADGKEYPYIICAFSEKKTDINSQNIEGSFIPLPSDDAMYGILKYSNNPNLYIKVIGVKTGTTSAGTNRYFDIDNYNGKLQVGQVSQYLDVSPDGNLSLLLSITNNNANIINIPQHYIKYSVKNNLQGATIPSWNVAKLFSAETGTLVTNVTLTESSVISLVPGEQKYIAINLGNGICICDANGTIYKIDSGTQTLMNITFYINEVQNIGLNIQVKWGGGNIGI